MMTADRIGRSVDVVVFRDGAVLELRAEPAELEG